MTCLAGVEWEGGTFIGADSLTVAISGATCEGTKRPKVFRHGAYVVAIAGSSLAHNVIAHGAAWTPPPAKGDVMRHLVSVVVPEIRKVMADAQWPADHSINMLVAARGQLFEVAHDLCVSQPRSGYAATGSAWQVALGSLFTSAHEDARERVMLALRAAAAHTPFVRGPYRVIYQRKP